MRYALFALIVLAPSRALALDPDLGARGQVVITDNLSGGATWEGFDHTNANLVVLGLSPSIDYFVARNIAIGADAFVGFRDSYGFDTNVHTTTTSTNIGLRFGVNVPLGRWLSLWPRATAYVDWAQGTSDLFLAPTTTRTQMELTLFVPLVVHVRSHVFVGVGPAYTHTISIADDAPTPAGDGNSASIHTVIGGYFGGEETARPDEPRVTWRRFGLQHEVAFQGRGTLYWSATDALTQWDANAAVGIDWFAVDQLSLGVLVAGEYDHVVTGSSTSDAWTLTIGPRVGFDVPISRLFSFYPQASLELGALGISSTTSKGAGLRVSVGVWAPILLHAAPHFFVGLGPLLYRDLAGVSFTFPEPLNNETRAGISLGVGGWL